MNASALNSIVTVAESLIVVLLHISDSQSSTTQHLVTWNLPGPICIVFISVLQLHCRVPGAGLGTALKRANSMKLPT